MTKALAPLMLLALVAVAIWAAAQTMAAAPDLSQAFDQIDATFDQARQDWQVKLSDTAIGERWDEDERTFGGMTAEEAARGSVNQVEEVTVMLGSVYLPQNLDTSTSHGPAEHPDTYPKMQRCFEKSGGRADAVFKQSDGAFHVLCFDNDLRAWFTRVINGADDYWFEKTGYQFDFKGPQTSYSDIVQHLANKWGAVKVTNPDIIPWTW